MIEMAAATGADASRIASIHAAAVPDAWPAAFVQDLLEKPNVMAALAIEGEPLGFVLARGAGDEAEILNIAVIPGARRRGIARDLIISITEQCKKTGIVALFLEVAEDNDAARGLYLGQGFQEVGRRPAYYRRSEGTVDALLLRLNLV